MKLIIMTMLFLGSSLVMAQNYGGMSEADMQRMMQQAQKAQACMSKIDQAKLEAIGEEAKQVEKEIKALCAEGKRRKAEKRGYAFAKEMQGNPDIAAARKCGEMMSGMMPEMPFSKMPAEKSESDGHICDE